MNVEKTDCLIYIIFNKGFYILTIKFKGKSEDHQTTIKGRRHCLPRKNQGK